MRVHIIQFLLIILLALICGLFEYINSDLTLVIYRGTITYVISKKLAMLICGMESEQMNNDNVNHPSHYQGKNECIDVMVAMFGEEAVKHFCMCNAYKYRFRSNMKNGEEDIKKAEWYEDKLIELNRGGTDEKSL